MEIEDDIEFIAQKSNPITISSKSTGNCENLAEWDRTALKRQFLAASGGVIGSISFGMTTGFSATLLPHLTKSSSFLADESTESWIASSVVLSMLIGVVTGSLSMRYLGRKNAQIGFYVPWMCGWLWVSYASTIPSLVLGCLLVGLGAGSHSVVSSIYIGETAEPRFRGFISMQISLGVTLGILLSHLLGIFLEWRVALRVSSVLPAIALALVLFAPESPTWLILRGRVQQAKKTFLWLRNDALECESELNAVVSGTVGRNRMTSNMTEQILSKGFLKAFLVLNVLLAVQQGSGLNVIVFYAVKIFSAMSSNVDIPSSMIIVDTVRLLASLTACAFVKITGRRKLYFCSAIGALISLIGVISCIIFKFSAALLTVSTCAYIWFLYVGLTPIPWIMVAELYPANLKEIGSCMSSIFAFLVMFVVVKTAPFLMSYVGAALMFAVYAVVIVTGTVLLYFIMPETNNITLQQIEENMKN